jgi:hypothetical protein
VASHAVSLKLDGRALQRTWVGLGGFHGNSQALEQIGVDADCSRAGGAVYSAWYELVPAAPVAVKLKVHAGDAMAASVTVKGHGVTLRIRNLSTGKTFARTRRVSRVDSSSAEWIVEAPSVCVTTDMCRTLTLTDFGSVTFSDLSATAGGRTGPVEDPLWRATELELHEAQNFPQGPRASAASVSAVAVPSALSSGGSTFAMSWGEQATQTEQPTPPTLPGFNGGASVSQARSGRSYTYLRVSLRDSSLARGCLASPCLALARDTVPSLLRDL